MKAYLCLFLGLFNQNDVLAYSTSLGPFGQGSSRPLGIPMHGGSNQGIKETVVQAQGKTHDNEGESNVFKPVWEKNTEWLHDSNKPLISNNIVGSHKGTEIKGTTGLSERSENDNDIVSNIGEPRQPGSIFFNPYWTKQGKNPLYNDNNGFNNHLGNNGFNNHLGQSGIYTGSKGNQQSNIVQIGKGFKSQLWKPQYVGDKGSYNHPGHIPLSGSKGNKQSNNFQEVKSFYSPSRDTLNSNHPKGKKKAPFKLGNSLYNSIHNFQSSTQNLDRSDMFEDDVRNNQWDKNISQIEKSDPVLENIKKIYHKLNNIYSYQHDKPNPLRNRIMYSKREVPMKKQQGNQEITNWLPELLSSALNSSSFEKDNVADEPSETKTRVHPYRHKRSTNMNDSPSNENDEEGTPTVQFLNPNSENVGNLPVHHTLNLIDLGDIGLKTDPRLEMNTLTSGTITDKRVKPSKGHSWNQRDLKYSGNLIHPARHSLNPIILAAKGLNTLYQDNLNTDHLGGRNTNHPDEYSNGNPANDQNVDIERNIHYPDITGIKNVHPKDLLHYLRIFKDLVVPTSSTPSTGVKQVPNATIAPTHILSGKEAAKWGGILFRGGSPKNGTRSRFTAFPLGRSDDLRADGHNYTFHFGGILFWG